jgi:hypothetical protein
MSQVTFIGQFALKLLPHLEESIERHLIKEKLSNVSYDELISESYTRLQKEELSFLRFRKWKQIGKFLFFLSLLLAAYCCSLFALGFFIKLFALQKNTEMGWAILGTCGLLLLILFLSLHLFKLMGTCFDLFKSHEKACVKLRKKQLNKAHLEELGSICYLWFIEATDSSFPYKKEIREKKHSLNN